jgi:DNA-binding NarL/FixJ family response regulator
VLALAHGEATIALDIADELLRSAPNIPATSHDACCAIPSLGLLYGEALIALGRDDEAQAALRATQEGARTYGMRPILWRAHLALAGLYRAARRPDEAEREFAAARAIVDVFAAEVSDDALREAFVRGTDAVIPRPRPAAHRDDAAEYGGLSAREREVAALVAAGKSNRAIAQTLFLSERTVAAHLGNIFTKLAISSRTQLAGWAIESGLAPRERPES